MKFDAAWTVRPHDPPVRIGSRLLTVTGEVAMPLGGFSRRMSVVRLGDGGGVVYSPMALDEQAMAQVVRFAPPAYLVIPNPHHRLDLAAWLGRFPDVTVIAPRGARSAVVETVAVDARAGLWDDPTVRLASVGGTDDREVALSVDEAGEVSLIVADVIANVRHPHSLPVQVIARLFGFEVDRPHLPRPVARAMIDDRLALAAQYRRWAAIPGLARILPAHGGVLENPVETLHRLAADIVS